MYTFPSSAKQCNAQKKIASFDSIIPPREVWDGERIWCSSLVNLFTDGSKLDGKVGGGVFCEELGVSHKFRQPDHCSVCQAEVAAIKDAVDVMLSSASTTREFNTYSDSQAAVKALRSANVRSRVVKVCLTSLAVASSYFKIRIIWMPGHKGIPGNCSADLLAREGTCEPEVAISRVYGIPLAPCSLLLDRWASDQLSKRWADTTTCLVPRSFWPVVDSKRSADLLGFTKEPLSMVIGVLTGHCPMGVHAVRLNIM